MAYIDKGRTQNNIRSRMTLLRQSHPEMQQEIEQIMQAMLDDTNEEYAYITLDSTMRQRYVYHLAGYLYYVDERKLYWLYLAIAPLLGHEQIDQVLRQKFGSNYSEMKSRIPRLGSILGKLNFHLNNYDEKKLRDGDIGTPAYNATMDALMKIPFIDDTLEKIFVIIATYTSLGQVTVPAPAFLVHASKERKLNYDEKNTIRQQDVME